MLKTQKTGRMEISRLVRDALALAAMALLARAQVMLGLAPFALALFAAGLYAQANPAALLAGCVLGALRFPLALTDLLLPSGCALVLLGALLLDRFAARAALREGPLCALLAGTGTLLPGLAAAHLEAYDSLLALLAASAAVLCAPAFRALLLWRPGKPVGMDERACAALALFALLMGACALWPPGAYSLACLAVLAAAHASLGAGAALGALALCALISGGGAMVTAVSVCLGGAVAGLLRPRGRLYAAPGFVLAAGLAGLYAPEAYAGPVAPALAALCYVVVPEAWLEALCDALFRPGGRERAAREEASRALNALSAAFGELAAGVANLPDEQAVLVDMRKRLCAQCSGYERCWAGDDGRAVRAMCRSIADAAAQGEAYDDETPPDVMRACRRGDRLRALAREEARALEERGGEEARAGEMFRQAERILGDVARQRARPRDSPPRLSLAWGASARSMRSGQPSGDAHLLRRLPDGRTLALVCDGMGSGEAARAESERAARLLWKFLSARVEPEAALSATNALMVARGAGDMFATVDLCLIDSRAGKAQFWKLAASRSLIAREGEVLVIEGGRLPLGVLEGVSPMVKEVELRPGDVIVMGSDGAMEAGDGAMEEALAEKRTLAPDRLSEELLRTAEFLAQDGRRDDMTVVCIGVGKARAP